MALNFCYEGEKYFILDILYGATAVIATLTLRLYQNDVTPNDNDTYSTYTECNQTGYAAISLTRGTWTRTIGTDSAPSVAEYAEQTFAFTGGTGTCYGYYVTANISATDRLLWSERFDESQAIFDGATVKVTPRKTVD